MTKPTTEELKDLLDAATPGPWNVTAPVEGSPEFMVIQHGPHGWSECGKYLSVSGQLSSDDATLIAIAPTLAAEVVQLRSILERIVSEYYTEDNGRSLRWEVDIARQALSQK